MSSNLSRRGVLTGSAATGAALIGCGRPLTAEAQDAPPMKRDPFRYCLNMSTIRGQNLPLPDEIDIAAKAGYDGIEPWIGKIDEFVKGGGSLNDLAKRIADHGLKVESAIGFANWIVDDDARRARGLEDARRDMEKVAALGGSRIAAPPAGAAGANDSKLDLFVVAARYRALLEVGDATGVTPMLEVWGFSKNLSRLGETMFAVIESGHPKACALLDVYHVYKGGSDHTGMKAVTPAAFPVLHINDYPADPPRDSINDGHRVYPGDGVAPLDMILGDMASNGSHAVLSLELFNKDYWQQDALTVAKTGLEKSKAAVRKALKL